MIINERKTSAIASSVIWAPTTIKEALAKKKQFGTEAEYISSGTLLQLQWENGKKVPKYLISLEKIQELRAVEEHTDELVIGALTSLASCRKHSLIKKEETNLLAEAVAFIAAPAVRNRATIGGNIAGRVGDVIPALLALDAQVTIQNEEKRYKQALWSWFINQADEQGILTNVHLPIYESTQNVHRFYKKIGRREAFTAAIVTIAGCIKWSSAGELIFVRIAVGGGDNVPQRLLQTERLLTGKQHSSVNWKEIYTSIIEEFIPATDVFVSGEYRKKIAANLIISQLKLQGLLTEFSDERS